MTGEYRDLPAELTRHTKLVLIYACGAILLTYAGGLLASPLAIFAILELPLVIGAAWVLAEDKDLQIRLPLLWSLTAVIVVGMAVSPKLPSVGGTLVAFGLFSVILYWLCLVVSAFSNGFSGGHGDDKGKTLATFGAALIAVGILLSVLVRNLSGFLSLAPLGRSLVGLSGLWATVLPLRVVFLGLTAIGLVWNAALLFEQRPYRPLSPNNVFHTDDASLLSVLVSIVRWPIWITIIVVGYALKFTENLAVAGAAWVKDAVAQSVYAGASLIGGPLVLFVGHKLILAGAGSLSSHLTGSDLGLVPNTASFMRIHITMVLGLSFYAITPVLVGMRFRDNIELWDELLGYVRGNGAAASISVGRAFALLGIMLVAVPIAAILPGSHAFGPFSIIYSGLLGVAVGYYFVALRFQKPTDSLLPDHRIR